MAERLSWSALPNVPRVMIEFAAGRPDVLSLLGGDFRDREVRAAATSRRLGWNIPSGLGDALRAGYEGMKIPAAVNSNLELLNQKDALVIVTGQQIGLFGGPLFTFYKALHTVLLAERLSAEAPGPVIPLFWMETADADFGEVNRIAFPPENSEPRRAVYTPADVVAGKSISLHELAPEIDDIRAIMKDWLVPLKFGEPLVKLLDRSYPSGRLMSASFRELFNEILGELGLVMVDARHPAMIQRGLSFWERALAHPDKLNDPFVMVSRELDQARLPLQVQLRKDALPVMQIGQDGIRRRVLGKKGEWRIGTDGEPLDNAGLARIVKNDAASLTPSALLRPIYQDWLLPTWIYVGGPAEVSYHAQIGRAYDSLEVPRPLIAPRMSLTLVERTVRRSLDKQNWSVADAIGGREIMLRRSGKAEALESLFDRGAEHFQSWLQRIERAGDEAGIALYDEIDQSGRKISHQWNRIKNLALNKLMEQDKSRLLHATKVIDRLVPDGILQERQTSILYFLAIYGDSLISTISNEVDLFSPQHLAIDVGSTE